MIFEFLAIDIIDTYTEYTLALLLKSDNLCAVKKTTTVVLAIIWLIAINTI